MSTPLDVITQQAKKGNLTEQEVNVLEQARRQVLLNRVLGFASGIGMGFYLSRKTRSIWARGLMVMFSGLFVGSISTTYASYVTIRDISDKTKYPHIAAAISDISDEIYRSRGIDPRHPERSRPGAAHRVQNLKNLPPSMTPEEKEVANAGGFAADEDASLSEAALDQKEHQQMEFGNPSLQHRVEKSNDQPQYRVGDAGTNSESAWDSIRATNGSQANAWDRVRKQNFPQQQQQQQRSANQTAQRFEDSWDKMYQNESNLYTSDSSSGFGSSSPLGSEDFPRSREDFERDSRKSNSKYGGGSAFSS
ncbi:hypothetical protein LPJ74_000574 [Coemansia sp. RSA 1843]|nr:hypothetical protein LPJ74_000574 [Coemansia sp. RSA 1843]